MSTRTPAEGTSHTQVDRILDAVRACVLDLGVRRTTFAEVARRAGVSRMTLYRRFPDVRTAVAELMTRELTELLRGAERAAADQPTARARLVTAAVHAVDELPAHPLLRRVVDVDAELLVPYVIDRLGGTQQVALELFEKRLAEGQVDGSVRSGDPARLAHTLLLVTQSFVLSRRISDQAHPADAVAAELRHLLDVYLRPDTEAGGPRP